MSYMEPSGSESLSGENFGVKRNLHRLIYAHWSGQCRFTSCKFKCKFSVFLIEHHKVKAKAEVEVKLHALLDSELDGEKWSASRNGFFVTGKRAPGSD